MSCFLRVHGVICFRPRISPSETDPRARLQIRQFSLGSRAGTLRIWRTQCMTTIVQPSLQAGQDRNFIAGDLLSTLTTP